jgi:energy-coupling factor transport system permease protein
MNDFEYLRLMPVGQYYPTGSVIHRLDARVKLLAALSLVLCLVFSRQPMILLAWIALLFIIYWIARVPFNLLFKAVASPLPFLIVLAVLQVFFNSVQDTAPLFVIGKLVISRADFTAGGILLLRFTALITVISLASFCTTPAEVTQGLLVMFSPLQAVGLPAYDLVMVVQVTLRFFPYLVQAAERIAKAQASRGADWGSGKASLVRRVRQVIPLIVPLFLVSLRRAENLALAMDARGYGAAARRSSLVKLQLRLVDYLAGGITVLLVAVTVAMAILLK